MRTSPLPSFRSSFRNYGELTQELGP
jgi:hypothetical protein